MSARSNPPSLADRVLAWTHAPRLYGRALDPVRVVRDRYEDDPHLRPLAARHLPLLRENLTAAERFVLEPDFVRLAARAAAFPPGGITAATAHVDGLRVLARLPFRAVWIEWPTRVLLEERVALGTLAAVAEDAGERSGILLLTAQDTDQSSYLFESWEQNGNRIGPCAVRGRVDTVYPASASPFLERRDKPGAWSPNAYANRCSLLLGRTPALPPEWVGADHVALDQEPLVVWAAADAKVNFQNIFDHEVAEFAGELRFLFAVLALLNHTNVNYVERSAGRGLIGGRSRPYLAHRTVTIRVPAGTRDVTRYARSLLAQAHHRAHQVRGHWRAAHVRCGRPVAGSWVRPHVRGDAALGWVHQDHVVTT